MASPITSTTGIGSGLQIASIVEALVNSDKSAKQTQITNQTKQTTTTISGIAQLKSALTSFQTAIKTLGDKDKPAFTGYAATSSSTAITATSSNSAVAGSYAIDVTQLATGSKVASKSIAGGATAVVGGSSASQLTIGQGSNSYTVDVAANATLQDVRDSINTNLTSKGLSANIITDSSGAARLVLSSTTTGAGTDLNVSGIADLTIDGTQSMKTSSSGAGYISAQAVDAKYTIDGLAMTSSSNKVDTAISGLSFTFNAVTTAAGASVSTPATVGVATNTDGLKTSIQSFVSAYNTLISTVNTLSAAVGQDSDGNYTVKAALTNDATARSLISTVRNVLVSSGAGDQLTALSQLGIKTTQSDGTLEFNSDTFTKAVGTQGLAGEVQNFFSGNNGLLSRMSSAMLPYTQAGGILDTRTSSLNKAKTDLDNQQAALDRRVETLTATLTKKYNDMDSVVGQLKATASSIVSMFDAMNKQNS
ncbi:flagellar filament capping protein FliD [Pseudomonas sp. KNUC1026]|uniref:flagellar filament capping protein FliD n=1 Tax=Pseudomonas sp. KNUC1026 TaxID=2893890 RepID=UPI001F1D89C6|nr:flagellar filament capping protein FliD [Pseudomonas sp. KNUC1026]UFH48008.1 flagellar filament capping protein FliD [Pseudomonas sp. KNUC1026]